MKPERDRHRFATTRWSLVISAGGLSPDASTALAELCDAYWYPAYAYARRAGYSVDDAADLTQAFFTRVLEKRFLKEARPERGRFRSFLLASLGHFISNERDWKNARKRGGAAPHVPIDFGIGENRYAREPADDLTPERIYERRWALDVLDRAMGRLSAKYATSGRHASFVLLVPHLVDNEPESVRGAGRLHRTDRRRSAPGGPSPQAGASRDASGHHCRDARARRGCRRRAPLPPSGHRPRTVMAPRIFPRPALVAG